MVSKRPLSNEEKRFLEIVNTVSEKIKNPSKIIAADKDLTPEEMRLIDIMEVMNDEIDGKASISARTGITTRLTYEEANVFYGEPSKRRPKKSKFNDEEHQVLDKLAKDGFLKSIKVKIDEL